MGCWCAYIPALLVKPLPVTAPDGETTVSHPQPPKDPVTWQGVLGGAAAGLTLMTVVIYFAGGLALAARMQANGFWWGLVLGQMPRQMLQEIAVSEVLLPAALFAALGYLLPHALLGRRLTERQSRARAHRFTARWRHPRAGFLLLASALLVPGAFSWYVHSGGNPYGVTAPPGWMIALAAMIFVAYSMMIGATVQRLRRYRSHRGIWTAVVTSAMLLAAVPGAVVGAASLPFLPVRVCAPSYEMDALHIGAGSDWAYLGNYYVDPHDETKRRGTYLTLVPTNRVDAVTVAKNGPDCGPTTGKLGTTTATPSPAP